MTFAQELKRRNVFRVGAAYVVTAWLLVQVAETLFPLFGFGDAPARMVVVILAVGFFPVLILTWLYELTPEGLKKDQDVDLVRPAGQSSGRKLDFAIAGVLVIGLAYFAFDKFYLDPHRDAEATAQALAGIAEVRELVDLNQYAKAYARAHELDTSMPVGPLREELWEIASRTVSIESEPPGAKVWVRPYNTTEADWKYVGSTPIHDVRVSLGMERLRMEKDGYRRLEVATWYGRPQLLDRVDTLPEEMVRVDGEEEFQLDLVGLKHHSTGLADFLIDREETTNLEYQEFVDEGGYQDPRYWEHKFIKNGRELSFEEAMALFKDKTGRPGPSTWEAGVYPEGMAEYPVGGISWYEAAAYASFKGKQLPTVFHWRLASLASIQFLLACSNFAKQGALPVGSSGGISGSGALDMAGNVREWVWNENRAGRFLLGGGWRDPEYLFVEGNAQSPFYRDELNGVRLMRLLDDSNQEAARRPVDMILRDYTIERPVSDDIFEIYRRLYEYDSTPLNAETAAVEDSEYWTRERIEFNAAYGNERMAAYLYIPKDAEPPFTPIVYFPGSNAIYRDKINDFYWPFLMRRGYAVLIPVYKGTYGRSSGLQSDLPDESNLYREHVIAWSKDLGRSIDYLETREDMDLDNLVYFGASWGAALAPVMIATEPRVKLSVLVAGGLMHQPTQPEVDPFNFLPRVEVPTLMITVPTDFFYPYDVSQKPMYDNLGSEFKKHFIVDGGRGHAPPMAIVVRETLDWFDEHLH
jgi:eukaryotic-like serine/threonine-protein kinase